MTTATRKERRLGRLRQIAKHVQIEKDLRAELEIVRARRDELRKQILALWTVLVHEFGAVPGEGHEPPCEMAARLLREQRATIAGWAGLVAAHQGATGPEPTTVSTDGVPGVWVEAGAGEAASS